MDDNNFLNSYRKKTDQQEPAAQAPMQYEEKSGFVKPRHIDEAGLSSARAAGRKKSNLGLILIAAAVVLLAIAGLIWYLNRGIEVIDLTNWTVNDAQLWTGENSIRLQLEEQYNDQFDVGKIFSQSAAKDTFIRKNAFIKIYVSLGHDLSVTLPLPDLMNMSKGEIEAWAGENFMTKVRITTEYNDGVAAGKVISFVINDNTVVDEVKRNTPVYVTISKGREEQTAVQVIIPDFKQMTIPQSYEFARQNGLILTIVAVFDDYAPGGTVIEQSAKAESKVSKDSEIILTVSKGKKILVPDFSGYSKQKAAAVAAELGMTMTAADRYSSQPAGGFLSQSLEAGSVYQAGDVLELTYSLGNEVILASYVGQARAAIEAWAKELNDQGASIGIKVTYTQSNSAKDTIIYQDKANRAVSVETTVRITVSLGKTLFVPDFVAPEGSGFDLAMTREKALALCDTLSLVPIFVEENIAGRLPGEIWYQSIAAGKEVYENTTITLKYCPANATIRVPAFTGMTKAAIISAGYLKKFDIRFVSADAYVAGYPDQICQQSLPVNVTVAYGSLITLTVSPAAPPEETTETTETIETIETTVQETS